jgi:hypothetical protein
MKLFELIFGIIITILLIIYFILCNNTEIKLPNHIHKFKISKINNDSSDTKFKNLWINIIGLILSIFIITYELNYITHAYNSNIYIRCIQIILALSILLLIHIPIEYKNNEYNHLSNAFKPLVMSISVIFSSCLSSIFLLF